MFNKVETKKSYKISIIDILFTCCVLIQFLLSISTSYMDSGFYNRVSVVLAASTFMLYIISSKKLIISKKMMLVYAVLLLILLYNYRLSVLTTQKLLVWLSCFFVGYIYAKRFQNKSLYPVLKGFLLILLVTGLYGVLEIAVGNILDIYAVRIYSNVSRIHSVFLHPIILAEIMLIMFAFNSVLTEKGNWKRLISVVSICCIIMTMSRFSWIILFVLFILIFIKNKLVNNMRVKKLFPKKRVIEALVIIGIGIFVLIKIDITSILIRMLSRWNDLEGSMSVTYRFSTIQALLEQRFHDGNILHWIIGTGYQSAQDAIGAAGIYFGTVGNNVVDNQIFAIFYDFGLIGISVIIYLLFKSIKMYLFTKNREVAAVSFGVFVTICMGFTCDTFNWATTGSLTFILFGFFLVMIKYEKVLKNNRLMSSREEVKENEF